MLQEYEERIKPLNDELGEMLDVLDHPMVGEITPHTENGITHVTVLDTGTEYELKDGKWLEVAPF